MDNSSCLTVHGDVFVMIFGENVDLDEAVAELQRLTKKPNSVFVLSNKGESQ